MNKIAKNFQKGLDFLKLGCIIVCIVKNSSALARKEGDI